ncbi:MAG: hypothetical protein ACNY01_02340 [Desulfobacteria bacterium]
MAVEIERKNRSTGKKETKIYETVAERVRKFREKYPIESRWSIMTTIEFPAENVVFASTEVHNPDGEILANGHAEENRTIGYINATSAVENAETSAIGRALFSAGFGGGEFCSADELVEALKKQEQLKGAQKKALPNSANNNADTRKAKQKSAKTSTKTASDQSEHGSIKGVTYQKEGNLLIAEGKTFQQKGLLKSAGFVWNKVKPNAWAKEMSA